MEGISKQRKGMQNNTEQFRERTGYISPALYLITKDSQLSAKNLKDLE